MKSIHASNPTSVLLCAIFLLLLSQCARVERPDSTEASYNIDYRAIEDGEIWFKNSQIQLRFDSEMYCRVFFQKHGKLLSIIDIPPDESKAKPPHFIEANEQEIKDFKVDYRNVGMSEVKTQFGAGKRLHLTGYVRTLEGIAIEKNLVVELYVAYPDCALIWATYRNLDKARRIRITKVANSFFRMDAARARPGSPSYAFWFFQGTRDGQSSSVLTENFSQSYNAKLAGTASGGGAPLIDLWTTEMGMAIADITAQTAELTLSLEVAPDRKVEMCIQSSETRDLGPDETLTTPKSIWVVHTGDFRAALDRYAALRRQQGT